MTLARPVAVAGVLLTAALLLAACGGDDDDGPGDTTPTAEATTPTASANSMTVASEDGVVALEIPEGALPAGFDVSTIRVTTVAMAEPQPLEALDLDAEDQQSSVVAVFRLEPSGLRFLRPVTLTVTLPSEIVTGPLVGLHSSEEGVEPLAIALSDRPESGQIEVTTSVEHFSDVLFVKAFLPRDEIIEADLDVPFEPVPVGTEFKAIVDIQRRSGTRTVDVGIQVTTRIELDPVLRTVRVRRSGGVSDGGEPPFVVDGAEVGDRAVAPARVVPALDPLEDRRRQLGAGLPATAVEQLEL